MRLEIFSCEKKIRYSNHQGLMKNIFCTRWWRGLKGRFAPPPPRRCSKLMKAYLQTLSLMQKVMSLLQRCQVHLKSFFLKQIESTQCYRLHEELFHTPESRQLAIY